MILRLHCTTQRHHCSHNAIVDFQMHYPYIKNVLLSVLRQRNYCAWCLSCNIRHDRHCCRSDTAQQERCAMLQGLGLCHGVSGNAYAFLSLYHLTEDDLYKRRAQQFGQFMLDNYSQLQDVPDTPLSMFEVRLLLLQFK